MSSADHYRVKAAEFLTMAQAETNPSLQREYAKMAQSYLRLALLADRNGGAANETPPNSLDTA